MIGDILQLNLFAANVCGLAINILLIWLIWRRTVTEMKAYSRILLQTCCIDICMIILNSAGGPIYVIFQGYPTIFLNGPVFLGHTLNYIVIRLWLFGFYFTTASSSIQFLYRFMVLCRRVNVNNCSHFSMLFVSSIFSIACVYLADLSTHPRDVEPPKDLPFTQYWRDLLGEIDDGTSIDLSFLAVPTSPEWLVNCAFAICFEGLCYFIIAFCGYQISKAMRKLKEIGSRRVVEANRQLNIVLLLQASLPLMAILVNATCLLATYNNKTTLSFMVYLFMPLHWQPLASPLITILTVRSFRNYVLGRRNPFSLTYSQNSSKLPVSTIKPSSLLNSGY